MSEMADKVRFWLKNAAKGARALAGVVGGAEGAAMSLGAGLLEGVSELLTTRTPEEVRELIYELVAHPAKKIDLSTAEREVARILAERRAKEAEEA